MSPLLNSRHDGGCGVRDVPGGDEASASTVVVHGLVPKPFRKHWRQRQEQLIESAPTYSMSC